MTGCWSGRRRASTTSNGLPLGYPDLAWFVRSKGPSWPCPRSGPSPGVIVPWIALIAGETHIILIIRIATHLTSFLSSESPFNPSALRSITVREAQNKQQNDRFNYLHSFSIKSFLVSLNLLFELVLLFLFFPSNLFFICRLLIGLLQVQFLLLAFQAIDSLLKGPTWTFVYFPAFVHLSSLGYVLHWLSKQLFSDFPREQKFLFGLNHAVDNHHSLNWLFVDHFVESK